jgi:hypothetical protein
MMGGLMPMLMGMMPLMCQMTMEMGKDGITCTITPADGASVDALRERYEAMSKMMAMGMPALVACGGQMLIAKPSK